MATITVNGVRREVQAPGDTPLLYVSLPVRSLAADWRSAEPVPF
jgi:hypothetical protein